jgi:hypothetical protein
MVHKTQGFLFLAGLVVLTGLLLAVSDQGRDLVIAVTEDGIASTKPLHSLPLGMLYATAVLLGLQTWFWARAIVVFRFGTRGKLAKPALSCLDAPRVRNCAVCFPCLRDDFCAGF